MNSRVSPAVIFRKMTYALINIILVVGLTRCQGDKTVIDVEAVPAAGSYERKVEVTLSASDSTAQIFYKMIIAGEPEPVEYSNYTAPFEIDKSVTLSFYATANVKKEGAAGTAPTFENVSSETKALEYEIFTTPPVPVEVEPLINQVVAIASPSPSPSATSIAPPAALLNAPDVSAQSPTSLLPSWSWVSGDANGTGLYRYMLDGDSWIETASLSFAATAAMAQGFHTLEVQEQNVDGVWSDSGTKPVYYYTDSVVAPIYSPILVSNPITFSVIQSDPPAGSTIGTNAAIALYFNDVIDPATINSTNISVTQTVAAVSHPVYGIFAGQVTTTGGSFISFVPFEAYSTNATIQIQIGAGLHDNDGGSIAGTSSFSYGTSAAAAQTTSSAAISFEDSEDSGAWVFSGNAGVVGTLGVAPSDGQKMVMLTTASIAAVSATNALDSKTSSLSLSVDVPSGKSKLLFDYDFMSEEAFQGAFTYDDTFTLFISGPNGAVSYLVSSVNLVGDTSPSVVSFLGFSNSGYGGPAHTGWQKTSGSDWVCPTSGHTYNCAIMNPEIDISALGSPLNVTFTVSDVADTSFTSIVTIDNIRFAN